MWSVASLSTQSLRTRLLVALPRPLRSFPLLLSTLLTQAERADQSVPKASLRERGRVAIYKETKE